MALETTSDITFRSDAVKDRDLYVARLDGREAISQPYRFELNLQCDEDLGLTPEQFEGMLRQPALIALEPDESEVIHGMVEEIEMLSMSAVKPVRYRVVVVPRMFALTRLVGSWVYQDMSVPQIVRTVLQQRGGIADDDMEFRLTQSYPKLEYVVQYQESDFAFVSRWLERVGISYYFVHGERREKIVFVDANEGFPTIESLTTIPYDPRPTNISREARVLSLSRKGVRATRAVALRDYNYRAPDVPLDVTADVDPKGEGTWAVYGEHFKSPDQGRAIARIRGQELACLCDSYTGVSNARQLSPGRKITLDEHVNPSLDKAYLLVEVEHHVVQAASAEGDAASTGYTNRFVAIPYTTPFRPARVTPRPRIEGVMHARIDGDPQTPAGAGPLDDQGRYKVLLPWDLGGQSGGRASRWMRMAQPMIGQHYGIHFPLDIGTEVLLAHIDGDPDRPVIVGAVPTTVTSSTVTSANATQSVIRTRTGIQLRFEDNG